MKTIKVMGGALAVALGVTTAFAAETRLTWAGGASGDWNAANAWTDEQGVASDWVDGAVAVLTGGNNTTVTIPEGVTIAASGIDCTPDDKAVFYVKNRLKHRHKLRPDGLFRIDAGVLLHISDFCLTAYIKLSAVAFNFACYNFKYGRFPCTVYSHKADFILFVNRKRRLIKQNPCSIFFFQV